MKRRPTGFTMIELLVAVVIVGIMAAMAMPKLKNGMAQESVRNARRSLVSHLSAARGAASSRGCRAVFHVVAGADPRVWVTSCPLTGAGVDTVGRVSHLTDDHDVSLSHTGDSLTFAPSGIGMGTSWMTVRFAKASKADSLSISPLGQARW